MASQYSITPAELSDYSGLLLLKTPTCNTCNTLQLLLSPVVSQYVNCPILTLDCVEFKEFAEKNNILKVPFLFVYKNGILVHKYLPVLNSSVLNDSISPILNPLFQKQESTKQATPFELKKGLDLVCFKDFFDIKAGTRVQIEATRQMGLITEYKIGPYGLPAQAVYEHFKI